MAAAKKPPVEITSPRFEFTDVLTANDLKRVCAPSFTTAAAALIENWEGEPVLMVGLHLSQDNESVTNSSTLLQGTLYKTGKALEVSKLWNTKANFILKIEALDLTKFRMGGNMFSEYLDSDDFDHAFWDKDKKAEAEATALADNNIKGFCLRVFLAPMSSKSANLAVLLFPASLATLEADHPQHQKPAFPGIVITRAEILLGPQTKTITDKIYGSPLMPVLCPSTPILSSSKIPQMCQLAGSIAALLKKTQAPDCKANHKTLNESWENIKRDGESRLAEKSYDKYWPAPVRKSIDTGRNILISYCSIVFMSNIFITMPVLLLNKNFTKNLFFKG